jgi:hypothetical protein
MSGKQLAAESAILQPEPLLEPTPANVQGGLSYGKTAVGALVLLAFSPSESQLLKSLS